MAAEPEAPHSRCSTGPGVTVNRTAPSRPIRRSCPARPGGSPPRGGRPAGVVPRQVRCPGRTQGPRRRDAVRQARRRITDTSLSEEAVRQLARDELGQVVDQEKVPLTPEERQRLIREVADDVLGHGPAAAAARRPRRHRDHGERAGPDLRRAQRQADPYRATVHLRGAPAPGHRADRLPGGPAHRRVVARWWTPGSTDGSRVNAIIPPLAVQRLHADHPQVRQGPVHRRRPDRLRHARRRRWPSCSTPASRPG